MPTFYSSFSTYRCESVMSENLVGISPSALGSECCLCTGIDNRGVNSKIEVTTSIELNVYYRSKSIYITILESIFARLD